MHSPFVCCNTERQEVVAKPQEREIAVPQSFQGQLRPADCQAANHYSQSLSFREFVGNGFAHPCVYVVLSW